MPLRFLVLLILLINTVLAAKQNFSKFPDWHYWSGQKVFYTKRFAGAQAAALEIVEMVKIDIELIIFTPEKSQGGSQANALAQLFRRC